MECEFKRDCLFFNDRMEHMPAESGVYKRLYCHGNSNNCARHMIGRELGFQNTPPGLYPNDRRDATGIISSHLSA